MYVVALYESESHGRNEVVVWDTILSGMTDAHLQRKGQWNKYSLRDYRYGLRGADVVLQMRYNVMPHLGMLLYGSSGESNFTLPHAYTGMSSSY